MHKIKGLEIFAVGKWNGDTYTEEDLTAMVDAFPKVGFRPPLKLGHADDQKFLQKDGLPAAGWVDKVYIKGRKLLADISGIPKKVYELIKNKAYKHVSSEIYWNLKRNDTTFARVLKAVALLGAETPAVSGLTPIDEMLSQYVNLLNESAAEIKEYNFVFGSFQETDGFLETDDFLEMLYQLKGGIQFVIGRLKGKSSTTTQTVIFNKGEGWDEHEAKNWLSLHNMKSDKVDEKENSLRFRQRSPGDFEPGSFRTITPGEGRMGELEKGNDKNKNENKQGADAMTIEELQAQLEEMRTSMEAKQKAFEEKEESFKTSLSEKNSMVEEMSKSLSTIKAEKIQAEVKAFAEGLVSKGVLAPAVRNDVESLLIRLAAISETVKVHSEGKEGEVGLMRFAQNIFEKQPKIVEFGESVSGTGFTDKEEAATAKLDRLIKEYAKVNKVSYTDATGPVARDNPDLAKAYFRE